MKGDQIFREWLLSLHPELTEEQQEAFVEHMERLRKPDGYCLHCGQPANQYFPIGPIVVTISEPDDNDKIHVHEFCNWECLCRWAAEQAGGDFIIDRN